MIFCGVSYPVNNERNNLNYIYNSFGKCIENKFYNQLNQDDLVLIHKVNFNSFKNHYKIVDQFNILKVSRFGILSNENLILLKKLSG